VDAINDFNGKEFSKEKTNGNVDPEKKNEIFTGFLAQEVEQAAKSLGYNFSGVDKPKDDTKQTYALRYSDFVVPIVKAMQEQQQQIEALKLIADQVDDLKQEIEALKKLILTK
jgi:hypothetical protein